jgi:hypothetical protein
MNLIETIFVPNLSQDTSIEVEAEQNKSNTLPVIVSISAIPLFWFLAYSKLESSTVLRYGGRVRFQAEGHECAACHDYEFGHCVSPNQQTRQRIGQTCQPPVRDVSGCGCVADVQDVVREELYRLCSGSDSERGRGDLKTIVEILVKKL